MRAGGRGPTRAARLRHRLRATRARTNRAAILRRPVSPAVHVRTRSFFLTPAHRRCQLQKETGRGCRLDNRGAVAGSRRPLTEPPREPLRALRASRPGGCLTAPAHRRFLFPVRTSGSATHLPLHAGGSSWDALFALPRPPRQGRTTLLQHARRRSDRASWTSTRQRGLPPGADRCRVRCWIQTPRRWQRRATIRSRGVCGHKCDHGRTELRLTRRAPQTSSRRRPGPSPPRRKGADDHCINPSAERCLQLRRGRASVHVTGFRASGRRAAGAAAGGTE